MIAEFNEALCSGRKDDDVEEFLCKMVSSGLRYISVKAKWIYMQFTIPESTYISEISN